MGDITTLLHKAQAGDKQALGAVFEAMYPELHRIAHHRLRMHPPRSRVNTTELVHDCYLKLVAAQRLEVSDRAHFEAYAARAMRSILVDLVRRSASERRGGDQIHVTLDTLAENQPCPEAEILEIDEALNWLATVSERLVRVVEMRYFCGASETDIAAALGVNERTVRRDWEKARVLLATALKR